MGLIIFVVIMALALALYDYFDTRDWQLLTSANRNNVVFEQRNKKYGAYTLRRDYNDLMITVLAAMFVLVATFSAVNFGLNSGPKIARVAPEIDTLEMMLPSPPVEENVIVPPSPVKVANGGGDGTPDSAPVDLTPNPMNLVHDPFAFKPTNNEEGKGNHDDGKNPNNTATTRAPSPFSGTGGADTKGRHGGVGGVDGSGVGPGSTHGPPGSGPANGAPQRKMEHGVDVRSIKSDEDCYVQLSLRVDPSGEVRSAQVVTGAGKTTTSNPEIIRQVRELVKAQVRYSKKDGTGTDIIEIRLHVTAS